MKIATIAKSAVRQSPEPDPEELRRPPELDPEPQRNELPEPPERRDEPPNDPPPPEREPPPKKLRLPLERRPKLPPPPRLPLLRPLLPPDRPIFAIRAGYGCDLRRPHSISEASGLDQRDPGASTAAASGPDEPDPRREHGGCVNARRA